MGDSKPGTPAQIGCAGPILGLAQYSRLRYRQAVNSAEDVAVRALLVRSFS